jgi:hypothetical protein
MRTKCVGEYLDVEGKRERMTGGWTKQNNEEIYNFYYSANIINFSYVTAAHI